MIKNEARMVKIDLTEALSKPGFVGDYFWFV